MRVTCPHCGFLTTPIATGDGEEPRCPRCDGMLFESALSASAESTQPAEALDSLPGSAAAAATAMPPAAGATAAVEPKAVEPDAVEPPAATPSAAAPRAAAPAAAARKPAPPRGRAAPSFARSGTAVAPPPRPRRLETAIVAALAALLVLQLLLAQRDELAASARWRPLVSGLCTALRCTLPPWREPAAFALLDRSVQPRPGAAGVLRVSASFRNDARWAQPWPTLRLSLADVDGREVGARAFAPDEYRRTHAPGELIAPGQSALVELEVIEPAPNIVAFAFDFE